MSLQPLVVRDLPEPPRSLWRIVGPGIVARGRRSVVGRVHPVAVHRLAGGPHLPVGRRARRRHAVLPQHGDRALHAGDGGDRAHRLQPVLEALGSGARDHGVLREPLAGMGAERVDARDLHLRRQSALHRDLALLVIGASLTLAPVVYVALERLIFVKVAAVGVVIALGDRVRDHGRHLARAAGRARRRRQRAARSSDSRCCSARSPLPARAAGRISVRATGSATRASAWGSTCRGWSARVTGEAQAARRRPRFIFEPTPENMARWRRWWRFANIEQFADVRPGHGRDDLPDVDAGALDALRHARACRRPSRSCRSKDERLQEIVGPWFGVLFWGVGAFSLFASAMGITDYTSRLAADILKSTYLRIVGGVREPALLPAGVGTGRRSAARSCSSA